MKIENMPGEFAFRAMVKHVDSIGSTSWSLTERYFFSREEAENWLIPVDVITGKKVEGQEIKWPIELQDGGILYVPDPSEMR